MHAAETRLLYENAYTGAAVGAVVAALLAYAQWDVVPRLIIVGWLLYMLAVSLARFVLARRYWRTSVGATGSARWNAAFVIGTAMAAAGWSAGAIFLYPSSRLLNEVFVVFVMGGIMLGSASLLAARPEAFLTFLMPTGFFTCLRLATLGDEEHLMMAFLGAVFTIATVVTTWRFHLAIDSSFKLRFANQNLIEKLQKTKDDTDAMNRALEDRVRNRTAQLLEADQRKDEFLATLSHELRNPLAAIRFALATHQTNTPPATAARARAVIERQVGQLVRLVDDLLDVSRITANKFQLRREPLELARLMTTAVESISPLATQAGHTLDVQLPGTPICVNGDSTRLVQLLTNVLHNAVKFTPRGGHIWIAAERQSNEVIVRIRDTGVGIAADVLPRVFDMFQQAEPTIERSAGGLGIGLTLARRLVEMHDGHIEIRSPGPGKGAEVEIRLPIIETPSAAATVTTEPPLASARRNLRVLIVEDNIDAAEMMELTLSQLGHVTTVVHDGASALTAANEFAPDVIFLDIGLPVMNGYAVARALRATPRFNHVYLAAVTGWGQDEDRRKAREAGCDGHFTKPLSPTALDLLLSNIWERKVEGLRSDSIPRTRNGDTSAVF